MFHYGAGPAGPLFLPLSPLAGFSFRLSFLLRQQPVKVNGFKLAACQGLLHGRQPQDGSEHGRQGPVIGESLVIEYQVLQSPLFDGLQHKAVGAVYRRYDLHRPSLQDDGLLPHGVHMMSFCFAKIVLISVADSFLTKQN